MNSNTKGIAACTAIICKNGMAISQDKLETNPTSKLINPRPKENDFNWIGHGISNEVAIKNMIILTKDVVEADLTIKIKNELN